MCVAIINRNAISRRTVPLRANMPMLNPYVSNWYPKNSLNVVKLYRCRTGNASFDTIDSEAHLLNDISHKKTSPHSCACFSVGPNPLSVATTNPTCTESLNTWYYDDGKKGPVFTTDEHGYDCRQPVDAVKGQKYNEVEFAKRHNGGRQEDKE
jgi:hypothetical protein